MSSAENEPRDTLLPTPTPANSPQRRSRLSRSQGLALATVLLLVVLVAGYWGAVGASTSKPDSTPDHAPTLRFSPSDSPDYTSPTDSYDYTPPSTYDPSPPRVYDLTPPSAYDLTSPSDLYDYTPSYGYPPGGYNSSGCPRDQWTNGYTRSNGTHVDGYYHNSPYDGCGGG